MDEEIFSTYAEWANDDLVWGRGQYNWCRAYSKEEWEKPALFTYDEGVEIPF